LILVPLQLVVTAPYGRHANRRWGPVIDNQRAWVIMESAALLVFWGGFGVAWAQGQGEGLSILAVVVALLWSVHYVNRAWVYPLRTRSKGKYMPLLIMFFALLFNGVNGLANGVFAGFSEFGTMSSNQSLETGRLGVGVSLFLAGMAINVWADNRLLALRSANQGGYSLPRGGLFTYISCPNFFGEIIEWTGFALLCWNLPALGFALWTIANLLPRALAHHAWYRAQFPDYPRQRKALIPYVV